MKSMKKILFVAAAAIMLISMNKETAKAAESESSDVESIVCNTEIGDVGRVVTSFEITVKDIDAVGDVTADDFMIENNVQTPPFNAETGALLGEYEDDGIILSIDGNTIRLEVTPFDYLGKFSDETLSERDNWKVVCRKYDNLSFESSNVTKLKTKTLDDVIRGKFSYAGLTRDYALYIQKNDDGSMKKNVPLVAWQQGGGEYNLTLDETLPANRGMTAWTENGYDTATLVIQIENPNYHYQYLYETEEEIKEYQSFIDQQNALQKALIDTLIADGIVNPDQIYIVGPSCGGGATMRYLMQYPDMVAGAIPMCSMDPIVSVHFNETDSYEKIVSNFVNAFQNTVFTWDENSKSMIEKQINVDALMAVPIYFVHADNDPVCSSVSSKAMYEAMNEMGDSNNLLQIYTDKEMQESGIPLALEHLSWVRMLDSTEEGDPMQWLFQQSKESEKTDETVVDTATVQTEKSEQSVDENNVRESKSSAGLFGVVAVAVVAAVILIIYKKKSRKK